MERDVNIIKHGKVYQQCPECSSKDVLRQNGRQYVCEDCECQWEDLGTVPSQRKKLLLEEI